LTAKEFDLLAFLVDEPGSIRRTLFVRTPVQAGTSATPAEAGGPYPSAWSPDDRDQCKKCTRKR
jgi:hypothetical protein